MKCPYCNSDKDKNESDTHYDCGCPIKLNRNVRRPDACYLRQIRKLIEEFNQSAISGDAFLITEDTTYQEIADYLENDRIGIMELVYMILSKDRNRVNEVLNWPFVNVKT